MAKMKKKYIIDQDEWWPVYDLSVHVGNPKVKFIRLSDGEYKDYKRVIEEFEKWQKILSDAYDRKD